MLNQTQNNNSVKLTQERKAGKIVSAIFDIMFGATLLVYILLIAYASNSKALLFTNNGQFEINWFFYLAPIGDILVGGIKLFMNINKNVVSVNAAEELKKEEAKKSFMYYCITPVVHLIISIVLWAIFIFALKKFEIINTFAMTMLSITLLANCIRVSVVNGIKFLSEKCLEERLLLQVNKERLEKEQAKIQE